MWRIMLLTGSGGLTDKGNELFFYFLHSIQIINKKDMSVTGFAGNVHQLAIVCIRKAYSKDNVPWGRKVQSQRKSINSDLSITFLIFFTVLQIAVYLMSMFGKEHSYPPSAFPLTLY